MTTRKVILVDMDGVLVKGPTKEHEESLRAKFEEDLDGVEGPEYITKLRNLHWSDVPDIFLDLEPMEDAIYAYNKLSEHHDLYIVSTPPWDNHTGWGDKKRWVDKHLPKARGNVFLTHNKHMVIGDYLIDDRIKHGVDKFKGMHIHFGQEKFKDWKTVLEYFGLS